MKFEAPIPGANFTSNTKNYAWHRPADITTYDDAVDYFIKKLDEPEETELMSSMLQIDIHITTVVSSLLMQAISKGKVPIDLAIIIAGPLARYIEIIAKGMGIKYEMGVEDKNRVVMTPTLLRAPLDLLKDEEPEQDVLEETTALPDESGLMSAPVDDGSVASSEEQSDMLGGEEEAPVEDEAVEEEPVDGLA